MAADRVTAPELDQFIAEDVELTGWTPQTPRGSEEAAEYEKSLCKFRLFCRHPVSDELYEKKFEVHKDDLLSTATTHAYKVLGLDNLVPLGRCRLVKYDEYTETMDQSFEDKHTRFGDLVGGPRTYYSFELFMEVRAEGEEFQVYNRGGLNLKLYVIKLPSEKVEGPLRFRGEQNWTVQALKDAIAQKYSLAVDTMVVAMETYRNEGKPLNKPLQTLKNEGFYRQHTVYVCCDPKDYQCDFKDSKMNRVINRFSNSILLHITFSPEFQFDLRVDRRNTLEQLKKCLEEYIHLPSSQFEVYGVYSNNQEYKMTHLHDSLSYVPTDTRMVIKQCRALQPGEFRIKLFLLRINDPQFMKPFLEGIVHKDMSIGEFKDQIIAEAHKQGVDEPLQRDRFRLRKKTWKSPGTVYLDHQLIEKDIHIFANFEMYVEPLEGPDLMLDPAMMQVYVRHWHPSTYTVDPTREVILTDTSPDHLRAKISGLSGIPEVSVSFTKAYGSFPCVVPVLDIEKDLEWDPEVATVTSTPLSMYDDGSILYFKDSREVLGQLSAERRRELQEVTQDPADCRN